MFKLVISVVLLLISLSEVNSLQLSRVCTAEHLRKTVEEFCMRLGRDTNSVQFISPYGSVGFSDPEFDSTPYSDAMLIEILKSASPLPSSSQGLRRLFRRSQEADCCHESCVISPEHLAPHCKML